MKVGFIGLGKLGLPVSMAIEEKDMKYMDMILIKIYLAILSLKKYLIKKKALINF